MKALVVDDSRTIRQIMIKALGAAGVTEQVEASNGREGLDATNAGHFDVILLDWNMPEMTGLEMLLAVRRAGKKTPVIMVTTEAEKSRVILALKAGANDYLIKPFNVEQLTQKLKNVLPAAN